VTTLESVPLDGGKALEDLSPREISRLMIRIQRMRHEKVDDLLNLTIALARANKDAEVAHAKAFLAHEGPQEERTQMAKLAAADLKFAAEAAKGRLQACVKRMDVLKDDWDSTRSIGANERAEMSLAGAVS
jgi:hypothetical protein